MKNAINMTIRRLGTTITSFAALLSIFAAIGLAQNIKNTDYSPDKALKSNARVNPSTLAMEMSIPLIGYPGRADNVKGAVLNYSSKVWGMEHYESRWDSLLGFPKSDIRPRFSERKAAGWSSSLGAVRLEFSWDMYRNQGSVQGVSVDGQIYEIPTYEETPPDGDLFYVKRVQVMMPDGSSHEMRASDTPVGCGTISSGTGCVGRDYTGTYLAVDGSRMRLEYGSSSSVLYLPDGGKYMFGATQIAHTHFDVHGNKSTYNTATSAWTDTMGRVLADPLVGNVTAVLDEWGGWQTHTAGTVDANFPGFGGASATYDNDIEWAELENALLNPSDPLRYTAWLACNGSGSTDVSPYLFGDRDTNTRMCKLGDVFNPVVMKKITFPNGQAYEFKYNVYGEIAKITYPTGAYERFTYGVHVSLSPTGGPYDAANRGVTDRWVSEKGDGTDELHWGVFRVIERRVSRDDDRPGRLVHAPVPLHGLGYPADEPVRVPQRIRRASLRGELLRLLYQPQSALTHANRARENRPDGNRRPSERKPRHPPGEADINNIRTGGHERPRDNERNGL